MAGDKNKLTEKQRQILEYLKQEILQRGFPPSVREICEAVSLRSTSSVHAHLETLERKGYIKRDATKPRAIEICDEGFHTGRLGAIQGIASEDTASQSEVAQIPLIGKVAAGEPILAVENIEGYFPMPVDRLPNAETFLLKVQGESMVNAGILDGDLVLVEQQATAENGEKIVALVNDSATVKRLIYGRAGTGKSEYCYREIAQKIKEENKKCCEKTNKKSACKIRRFQRKNR